jgi:hypothetical protein
MLFLPVFAAAALNTGDDLLAACVGDGPNKIACMAMVIGVANGAMLASQDTYQKILCFARIYTANADRGGSQISRRASETRSKPAPLLAYRALKERLPCPKG